MSGFVRGVDGRILEIHRFRGRGVERGRRELHAGIEVNPEAIWSWCRLRGRLARHREQGHRADDAVRSAHQFTPTAVQASRTALNGALFRPYRSCAARSVIARAIEKLALDGISCVNAR